MPGAEDLTIRETTEAISLMMTMSQTAVGHTLEYVKEPDHSCESGIDFIEPDEIPELDDWDVQVVLAFEDAMVAQFKFLREIMREQGFTVAEEVG
jgi:hypothetical protein